ncbi:MAG: GNAT family N-acetyltransferase [Dehalococcoidia bacterium]
MSGRTVEPLTSEHDATAFDSGKPELDTWIKRFALASQQAGSARVYVLLDGGRVVGFYALAAASVELAEAPPRFSKGVARPPIPVILLARLAVDRSQQGMGLGAALLKDALLRAVSASGEIGARAVLVHAKDEEARQFYEHFDFEPSPTDPLHLLLLMKDIRALLRGR